MTERSVKYMQSVSKFKTFRWVFHRIQACFLSYADHTLLNFNYLKGHPEFLKFRVTFLNLGRLNNGIPGLNDVK